jgi:ferredoxin
VTTPQIPEGAQVYKRSPTFSTDGCPAALLREHRTKAGVWGRIVVEAGALTLTMCEPEREEVRVTPSQPAVLPPTALHFVALEPGTRFHIEFHHIPEAGQ